MKITKDGKEIKATDAEVDTLAANGDRVAMVEKLNRKWDTYTQEQKIEELKKALV